MARTSTDNSMQLPAELVQHIQREAERDAADVAALLRALGLGPSGSRPLLLPPLLLHGLGAAMRIHRLEAAGLIPTAPKPLSVTVAQQAFLSCREAGETVAAGILDIWRKLMRFEIEQVAWNGQAMLQADVLVGKSDEEMLIDALAKFLFHVARKRIVS